MFVKHLILFALITLALTQHAPARYQDIVAGNYTVRIYRRGGAFEILKNHEVEAQFSPNALVEKDLHGHAIANRSVDLTDKYFEVYEADYNKTHPVKYIRLTSSRLNRDNLTDTVFKTSITLHKNAKNVYFTEAPTGSFEISHQIENWRSCHNTGNSTTDAPECIDEELRNLNETFIDLEMNINHNNYNNATEMINANETIRLVGLPNEEFIFRDTYNIQPGKSIRPEWEAGYPMMLNNTQTETGSRTDLAFRFKKPVLHKYDNTMIWFNYLYYNDKPMMESTRLTPTGDVFAVVDTNSIHLFAYDESVFYVKFNKMNIRKEDGLISLNENGNLFGLEDKYLVLRRPVSRSQNGLNFEETYGTVGNFFGNAVIKITAQGFKNSGNFQTLNGNNKHVHDGDFRVSFEVENFPFVNEGDSLEVDFVIAHPHDLKTLNEGNYLIKKYAKGQLDFSRTYRRDNNNVNMPSEYPKRLADLDESTYYNVNLGNFNRRAEFEFFLHPAAKTELEPTRRWDQTNWQSDRGGNIKALHDHSVECRENEVLSFWNLRSRSGKMSIEYYCISYLSVGRKAEWKYTRWNGISSKQTKSVNHLDRHDLRCDSDESLGAFRMELSGNYIRFRYRCNKTVNTALKSRTTKWENAGEGQIQNLKKHYIFAEKKEDTYKVVRGWRMHTKYVKKWCTFLCDDNQHIKFDIYYNVLRDYKEHI